MSQNCPKCGHQLEATDTQQASNSARELNLTIPEHHWPIFKMIFDQMNVRFGMLGLGEFANLLPSYCDQIPLDRSKFRYFEDSAIAYVFLGFERGYRASTRIEEGGKPDFDGNERMKVFVDLIHDERETLSLRISDCAYEDVARDVCAFLEEASERISPM